MDKYHLQDPKKLLNVLRALKKYKYDDKRIMAEFSIRRSMKKDVLPLAEQIMRLKIGQMLDLYRTIISKLIPINRAHVPILLQQLNTDKKHPSQEAYDN